MIKVRSRHSEEIYDPIRPKVVSLCTSGLNTKDCGCVSTESKQYLNMKKILMTNYVLYVSKWHEH